MSSYHFFSGPLEEEVFVKKNKEIGNGSIQPEKNLAWFEASTKSLE